MVGDSIIIIEGQMEKRYYGKRTLVEIDSFPKARQHMPFSIDGEVYNSEHCYGGVEKYSTLVTNLTMFGLRINVLVRVRV